MAFCLHDIVSQAAAKRPGKTAIIEAWDAEQSITYKELEKRVEDLSAQLLEKGLGKGERVGILSRNSITFAALYFAISHAGGIAVPLNHTLSSSDIARCADHCAISALYAGGGLRKKAREIAGSVKSVRFFVEDVACGRKPKEPAASSEKDAVSIIYTSGTTGEPLGVTLSHRNLISNNKSIVKYLNLGPSDKICCVLPFYYIYGLSLLFSHLLAGGTIIIENRFMYPNVILDTLDKYKATGFAGVSSHYVILLYKSAFKKRKFPALRYFMQAGDKMPPHITRELLRTFPKKKLYIMYGQTEASPRLTYLKPELAKKKPDSIGKVVPGVRIKLVSNRGEACGIGERGEITAQGDNIMLGYWNNAKETAQVIKNGWLHTGDIAFGDKDGDLFIVGRRKNFIKVGANRVNPLEIEHLLMEEERIMEVAAIGVPDAILGEAIKVFVALIPGRKMERGEILDICRKNLPAYAIPKDVTIVESMLKNSYGKINKEALKSQ